MILTLHPANVVATGLTPLATPAEIAADRENLFRRRERAAIRRNRRQERGWAERVAEQKEE